MATWSGQASIKGSTEEMRMALLTLCLVGISFTWGVEMTYCTPYLLALGLTKSKTSLVWLAGPLSGILVAPVVGVLADRSRSKYGRRRPFMVVGSIIVALALCLLGWAKEVVGYWVSTETEFGKTWAIVLAILAIYVVDFAINAVMWSCRSLIVDTLPAEKQQDGAAWSSRMGGLGGLIGYFIGTLDLVAIFGPSFGDTQFKKLILIAAGSLLMCVGITSWAVSEKVLMSNSGLKDDSRERQAGNEESLGIDKIFGQIIHTTRNLPPRIQALCWAQFWSWIGWFPFLFYSTTWVGETYFRYDAPLEAKASKDILGDIGRIGSMSLVIFSLVSTIGAVLLPFVVTSPDEDSFTHRPPASIAGYLTKINKHKPDLLTSWLIGHLMFSGAMFLAPFAQSFRFATTLVGFCGVPWSVACWAPYAFLGMEVNNSISPVANNPGSSAEKLAQTDSKQAAPASELSGIYFGILNIYTTVPQFVGTFLSMLIFAIMEPGKSPELAQDAHPSEHHDTGGTNAISVCLCFGAVSTLVSAWATQRLIVLTRSDTDKR